MKINNLSGIRSFFLDNKSVKQTIFKNVFWLTISLGVSKFLGLVLLIYAARILGAEEYGRFNFALAFASIFAIFYGLGIPAIITREFAKDKEKKENFYSIISLQCLLTLIGLALILFTSFFITEESYVRKIILTLALFSLINGFITIFYAFFQARQKMERQAWIEMFQFLMIFLFGFYVLFTLPSAQSLSYAYLLSAFVAFLTVLLFFHFKIFPLRVNFDFFVWKKFLLMSWPLALSGLFGAIYHYTDSVMMGCWNLMVETGWYNAAYKIIIVSLIPMGLISSSFYPALSKFLEEGKEKFQRACNYQIEVMIFLALPLVVGGITLASKIIYTFYPFDFFPAALVFQLLILATGIIFLYRPLYDILIVFNKQKKIFWATLSGAIINIFLNFILIPKYSLYGAAAATLVTNLLILIIIVILIKKYTFVSFPFMRIFLTFVASAIATFLMCIVIKQLMLINIFVLVFLAVTVYFFVFLMLRKFVLLKYFKYAYSG